MRYKCGHVINRVWENRCWLASDRANQCAINLNRVTDAFNPYKSRTRHCVNKTYNIQRLNTNLNLIHAEKDTTVTHLDRLQLIRLQIYEKKN